MLADGSMIGRQNAAGVIMALCIETQFRASVVSAGALPLLGNLIPGLNETASARALTAIWNLCFDSNEYVSKVGSRTCFPRCN
jgi:hypothetical protein